MKKILLLVVSILMVTVVFGQTKAYHIPSYNTLVTGTANFVSGFNISTTNNQALSPDKRDVDVENDGGAQSPNPGSIGPSIVVLIYSLSNYTILGPYTVSSGQTITVPIDDSAWGVTITTCAPTYVSLWMDNGQQQQQ